MTLAEIRDSFITKSGRYDLINDDGSDNGANFFIQSGSRFLDRHANLKTASQVVVLSNVNSSGLLSLPRCWLIRDVYLYVGRMAPIVLHKLHSSHAFQKVMSGNLPRFFQIRPRMFSANFRKVPASSVDQAANTFLYSANGYPDIDIELIPHPTQPVDVEVHGRFYSAELEDDTDTNVWATYYPDTLVKASMYELEVFYRNSEGAQDWLTAINIDLTDAEQLEVLQDTVHKGVMGL